MDISLHSERERHGSFRKSNETGKIRIEELNCCPPSASMSNRLESIVNGQCYQDFMDCVEFEDLAGSARADTPGVQGVAGRKNANGRWVVAPSNWTTNTPRIEDQTPNSTRSSNVAIPETPRSMNNDTTMATANGITTEEINSLTNALNGLTIMMNNIRETQNSMMERLSNLENRFPQENESANHGVTGGLDGTVSRGDVVEEVSESENFEDTHHDESMHEMSDQL